MKPAFPAVRPTKLLEHMTLEAKDPIRLIRFFLVAYYLHTGLRFLVLSERFADSELESVCTRAGWALLVAAGATLWERKIRFGPVLAAAAHIYFIINRPIPGNHAVLDALLVSSLALAVPYTSGKSVAAANLVRWACALVYLQSGLQKLLYGAYFNGSFFARMLSDNRFAWFFEWLLPADEYARVVDPDSGGPYLFHSLAGLVVSHSAYIMEIVSGFLLIIPRTRQVGVVVALITICSIEMVAREVGFGVGLIMTLMMFCPRLVSSRWFLAIPLLLHVVWYLVGLRYPDLLVP